MHLINWTIVLMPREIGGLGIRDLRLTNKALMMKWMWIWHKSANVWWKEISEVESIPWTLTNTSQFWKSIKQLAPIFDCSIHLNENDIL
jgi:hypothetical protein